MFSYTNLNYKGVHFKPLCEIEEEFMADRSGYKCPFCFEYSVSINREEDRQGIISANWFCGNCNEDGPCLLTGQLIWNAENEI